MSERGPSDLEEQIDQLQKQKVLLQNKCRKAGGAIFNQEKTIEGLKREIAEEIGELPTIKKTLPLESFLSNDKKFLFHTYLCVVEEEFIPKLNNEHDGYAWCSFTKWPKPLHHGLRNTLQSKINLSKLETVFQTINLLDS